MNHVQIVALGEGLDVLELLEPIRIASSVTHSPRE